MPKETKCPNCGAPMVEDQCPNCGTRRIQREKPPKKEGAVFQDKTFKWMMIGLFVFGFLIFLANFTDNIATRMTEGDWEEEEEESAQVGTMENPIAYGSTGIYHNKARDFDVEVCVTQVLRSESALDFIAGLGDYYKEPGVGKEYLLAKVRIQGVKDGKRQKISLSGYHNFACASASGFFYDRAYIPDLAPVISDIYPGEATEGYLCFIVETGDPVLIGFRGDSGAGAAWFASA